MAEQVTGIFTRDDRDLLIELKTQVGNIRGDIKDLKDGTTQRIENLEKTKAEKNVVEELQNRVNKDIELRVRKLEEDVVDPTEHKKLLESMSTNNIYLKWMIALIVILIGVMSMHILGIRIP